MCTAAALEVVFISLSLFFSLSLSLYPFLFPSLRLPVSPQSLCPFLFFFPPFLSGQKRKFPKTCGPDGIPAIVLKKRAPDLAPVLSELYNKFLTASCVPADLELIL